MNVTQDRKMKVVEPDETVGLRPPPETAFVMPSEVMAHWPGQDWEDFLNTGIGSALTDHRTPLAVWDYFLVYVVERAYTWAQRKAPLDEKTLNLVVQLKALCHTSLLETFVLYGMSNDLEAKLGAGRVRDQRAEALLTFARGESPLRFYPPQPCFFRWPWEPPFAAGVRSRLVSLIYSYTRLVYVLNTVDNARDVPVEDRYQVIVNAWSLMAYMRQGSSVDKYLKDSREDVWQQIAFTDILNLTWNMEAAASLALKDALEGEGDVKVIREESRITYDEDMILQDTSLVSLAGLNFRLSPEEVVGILEDDADPPPVFTLFYPEVSDRAHIEAGRKMVKLMTPSVQRSWRAESKGRVPSGTVFVLVGGGYRPFPNLVHQPVARVDLADRDIYWLTPIEYIVAPKHPQYRGWQNALAEEETADE